MQKPLESSERLPGHSQSTSSANAPAGANPLAGTTPAPKPKVDVLKAARLSIAARSRLAPPAARPAGYPQHPATGRPVPGATTRPDAPAVGTVPNGTAPNGTATGEPVAVVAVGRSARKRSKTPLRGSRLSQVTATAQSPAAQRLRQRPETRSQMLERLTNPIISLHEASVLLDVCPATVRRYTKSGMLTHVRTEGQQRRFYLKDVLALIPQLEPRRP